MGFFKKLVKAGIDTVALPVAIVKDVVSMGGAIEGNQHTYTGKQLRKIGRDIEEAKEELDD